MFSFVLDLLQSPPKLQQDLSLSPAPLHTYQEELHECMDTLDELGYMDTKKQKSHVDTHEVRNLVSQNLFEANQFSEVPNKSTHFLQTLPMNRNQNS
jgi:hypothetical protein